MPVDHGAKGIKGKNLDKYLDLAGEVKKQGNMKMTTIMIITGPLGSVHKNLEKDSMIWILKEELKPCRLLKPDWILRSVPKTRGDLPSPRLPQINHQ